MSSQPSLVGGTSSGAKPALICGLVWSLFTPQGPLGAGGLLECVLAPRTLALTGWPSPSSSAATFQISSVFLQNSSAVTGSPLDMP